MGVGQGESRKERVRQFAELAKPATVLDPVVTVVMRLFAPPTVADDRITQTERTPADKPVRRCYRPVESWLAMVRRKWDKGNRTALGGSLTEQNLATMRAQKRAFLLPAQPQLTKDNSVLLATG